jgi:glucose-6-phosphate isomerase
MSDILTNNTNQQQYPLAPSLVRSGSTPPPILARVNHKLHQRNNVEETPQYTALQHEALRFQKDPKLHLKHLLADASRCLALMAVHKSSSSGVGTGTAAAGSGSLSSSISSSKFDVSTITTTTTTTEDNNNNTKNADLKSTRKSMIQRHDSKNSLNGNTNNTNGIRRKIILDYSRQHVTGETMELLFDLADRMGLTERMSEMRSSCSGFDSSSSSVGQQQQHALISRMPKGYYDRPTATGSGGGGGVRRLHNPRMVISGDSGTSRGMDGIKMLNEVHSCFDTVSHFSEEVRDGIVRGCTGKILRNVVCIIGNSEDDEDSADGVGNGMGGGGSLGGASNGGGGSGSSAIFSGPEAVHEALSGCVDTAIDSELRFVLGNDPEVFHRSVRGLNSAETLIIVVFVGDGRGATTGDGEVTITSRIVCAAKRWLFRSVCPVVSKDEAVAAHFCAVAPSLLTSEIEDSDNIGVCASMAIELGIPQHRIFPIYSGGSGRFSVWSAIGVLPLSIIHSHSIVRQFLDGAHDIDEHFFDAPLGGNIPVLLGLLGVWNSTFMGYHARALLPYSSSLSKFPNHVQKFDMEGNGKGVSAFGVSLPFHAGEIDLGATGCTDGGGRHSFYQLLHQGRPVPVDFIGFMEGGPSIVNEDNDDDTDSQPKLTDSSFDDNAEQVGVSSHDELMANFFAQPDALAYGKTLNDLIQEGVEDYLRPHKVFPGNRPSSSILMTKLDAFAIGQLLAIYEHRTAVQGYIWGINSFDSYGTELGKVYAKRVKAQLSASRRRGASVQGFNSSSGFLLEAYLSHGRVSR